MKANPASPLLVVLLLAGCSSAPTPPRPRELRDDRPVVNAAELLRHHPAVRLQGTGSAVQIFIRGSLHEPLVVLDGLPLRQDPGGALAAVDPRDVATIKVLTDPADLTFYGIRGANGVIVVTTRLH